MMVPYPPSTVKADFDIGFEGLRLLRFLPFPFEDSRSIAGERRWRGNLRPV